MLAKPSHIVLHVNLRTVSQLQWLELKNEPDELRFAKNSSGVQR
jgi:hypothetical protein